MKISLVTIIDNDQNIGTYLQAYSLVKVLERKGYEVEVVDYYRRRFLRFNFACEIFRKNTSLCSGILSVIYRLTAVSISKRILKGFLAKNAKLTPHCYRSLEDVERHPPEADIYMTGSDQVWNSYYNEGIEKTFYLDFAPKGKKKFSYAASIGMNRFPDEEVREVKQLLSQYDRISVRESSAVKILEKIGIDNVEHVVDPTLLISNEEWSKIAETDSFVKTEPYLLIYSVEDTKKELIADYAKAIASKMNLKIYMLTSGGFREKINCCDKIFYFASPERFLNLMQHADFVIVSSFHGTAFSVSLDKQFISICPDRFNSRIYSLLDTLGLLDRIIKNGELVPEDLEIIDYPEINKLLGKEIDRSFAYLDSIL
jgi:polysaccharide pyruvyl transferase WcaK-like protein